MVLPSYEEFLDAISEVVTGIESETLTAVLEHWPSVVGNCCVVECQVRDALSDNGCYVVRGAAAVGQWALWASRVVAMRGLPTATSWQPCGLAIFGG
jgi:hypothetical protein